MLVIACPCALVISTPVTIVSGLAAAARKGILIKGGAYLEQGRKLKRLALDKTGTITHGKPVQTEFEMLSGRRRRPYARTHAASLAGRSDHPVSMAIAAAAKSRRRASATVERLRSAGGPRRARRIEGMPYWLGNHRLVEELGHCSASLEARLDALERQGKTVVMLMDAELACSRCSPSPTR